jgi:hypothetical protein
MIAIEGHHGAHACTENVHLPDSLVFKIPDSPTQKPPLAACTRAVAMPSKVSRFSDLQFLIEERAPFEVVTSRRRRLWQWRVCDRSGTVMMEGQEKSRVGARYHSARALFLLLLTTRARAETWRHSN